jgi:hypothetical protein
MTSEQAESIMGNTRSWSQQDDGNSLVGNLVITGLEIHAHGGDEAQAPIFDLKPAAFEPDEAVVSRPDYSELQVAA